MLVFFFCLVTIGFVQAGGSISGTMYEDTDGSNFKNASESGIAAGIVVFLLDFDGDPVFGSSGPVLATTDGNGDYLMTDVPVGNYQLLIAIADPSVPAGYVLGTPEFILGVDVFEGIVSSGYDFGYDPVGDIEGSLFLDVNVNDINDNEAGVGAGLSVYLLDDSGNPVQDDNFNDITTTTDGNGDYIFENVSVDTGYQVRVDPADTQLPARTGLGTPALITGIEVIKATSQTGIDFGYDQYASLYGTLFKDDDENNVMNGTDTGLGAGVQVYLNYNNGLPVLKDGLAVTALSNSFGNYSFIDVIANQSYQVEVNPIDINIPSGYALGTSNTISNIMPTPSLNLIGLNFGYDAIPLPIELIDFVANEESCNIRLNWTTAHEYENEIYEIERSRDGIVFEKIGARIGAGTTSDYRHYSFIDETPWEENYYRLKQIDFNGESSFSEVISISFLCIEDDSNIGIATIYPNPIMGDQLNFKLIAKENLETELIIVDQFGRVFRKQQIRVAKGMNALSQDVANFPAGIYFVQVDKSSQKFIRVRD